MYRTYYFILLILGLLKQIICIGNMLGQADFIFKSLEACPDVEQKGGIDFGITKKKYNRTVYLFDIDIETEFDVNDLLIMEFKGSIKKEGGYKEGYFYMKKPMCEAYRTTLGNIFVEFLNAVGFEDCPITTGSYSVKDFYFNNEEFTVPQLYGEFKMDFLTWKNDELITCSRCYYEFVPK